MPVTELLNFPETASVQRLDGRGFLMQLRWFSSPAPILDLHNVSFADLNMVPGYLCERCNRIVMVREIDDLADLHPVLRHNCHEEFRR